MDYSEVSKQIMKEIGGESNVNKLTHCITRLRFELKDEGKASKKNIEAIPGVMAVVTAAGQYQVVVGNNVTGLYKKIVELYDVNTDKVSDDTDHKKNLSIPNKILDYISGCMTPIIAPLIGASLIKGLITLLVTFGILASDSSTYAILSAASNSIYYFLPVMLAFSAGRKLGVNPFIAACIAASLLEPNFTALFIETGNVTHFIGIPILMFDYASSLVPALISTYVYSLIDKQLNKWLPTSVKSILVPFTCMIICVPLTAMVFGPCGYYISIGISKLYFVLYNFSPILTGAFIGSCIAFTVMLGLHWAIIPIIFTNLAAMGFCPLAGAWGAAGFAQCGVPVGVAITTKDKKERTSALSIAFTAIFAGVTEPVLYGYVLKNKLMALPIIIAGGIGGAVMGAFNTVAIQFSFINIFTLPLWNSNGSTYLYIVLAAATMILSAVITRIVYKRSK